MFCLAAWLLRVYIDELHAQIKELETTWLKMRKAEQKMVG